LKHRPVSKGLQSSRYPGSNLGDPSGAAGAAIPEFFLRRPGEVSRGANEPYAWAAEVGGHLVGLLGLSPSGDATVRIRWLRIEPEWQHTSVTGKLIRRLREHCNEQGHLRIVADARLAPRWFWRMFQQRGFRLKGRQGEFQQGELEFVLDLNYQP
jgi:GNAT superfamily N-acetyltransferase